MDRRPRSDVSYADLFQSHRATAEGSWRAKVYAGNDPLTGLEIRFWRTCKSERDAQLGLGKLLALARGGAARL